MRTIIKKERQYDFPQGLCFLIFLGMVSFSLFADAGTGNLEPLLSEEVEEKNNNTKPPFYYSNGNKTYLQKTGFEVIQIKDNIHPSQIGLEPVTIGTTNGLSGLAEKIQQNNMHVVKSQTMKSAWKNHYDTLHRNVEMQSPILKTEKNSLLIVLPYIIAKFEKGVQVEEYIKNFGLKINQNLETDPNLNLLSLTSESQNYQDLFKSANKLYEVGIKENKVIFSHPDFMVIPKKYDRRTYQTQD